MIAAIDYQDSAPVSTTVSGENLLELRGITKRFAGVKALSGVDLDLRAGEILALLGENGAGKSTLMKVLSGVHQPDEGTIKFDGKFVTFESPRQAQDMGISIIYQEFSLAPHLPAYENVFLGRELKNRFGMLDRKSMKQQTMELLARLGVLIDVTLPVSQLSIAEQQFLEIAKALARNTRILILDEPTATLTSREAGRLFDVMEEIKKRGVAMVFISHHLEEIFQIADRVQCLRDGKYIGVKSTKDVTPRELVSMIAGRDIEHAFPPPQTKAAGDVILNVRKLQRRQDLPEVRFHLNEGEILGFAGLIGSGRTEVIRAVIGADKSYVHEIDFEGNVFSPKSPADSRKLGIGLLPEDRKQQGLILPFSVSDNITLTNLSTLCHQTTRLLSAERCTAVANDFIKNVRIKTPSSTQIVRNLSGGNQQKVVIAKWLHANCKVLIFDEPTRGIDVGAKAEIYELMRKLTAEGVAIIMISSELPEVVGMSDRVIVMRNHRIEKTLDRREEITAENIMLYATGGHQA